MDGHLRFSRALIVANPIAGRGRGHAAALRLAEGSGSGVLPPTST